MSDLYDLKVSNALDATAIADTDPVSGEIIDTQGFGSLTFAIKAETIADGSYTPALEHGDEADLSDAAEVDGDLLGAIADATFAATDGGAVKKLGYNCAGDGTKRFVRLVLTGADITDGGTLSAIAIQGTPRSAPVA